MKKLFASLFIALTLVACGGGDPTPSACQAPVVELPGSPNPDGPTETVDHNKPKPPVAVPDEPACDESAAAVAQARKELAARCLYGCGAGQWVWDTTNWAAVIEYNGEVSAIEYIPGYGVEIDQQIGAITEGQFTTVNVSESASDPGYIPPVDLRIIADVYGRYNVRDLQTGTVLYNSFPQIVGGKRIVPIFRKRFVCNDC